tara:strand:- start:173 stop:394 length:222 start_codon:yes stop_codon:yes gene_type:complete
MPSHYAEQEEQVNLQSRLGDLKIKKNELLEEIQKNEMAQREVKDKIDEYNRESRSRYYQLNFWEQPSENKAHA